MRRVLKTNADRKPTLAPKQDSDGLKIVWRGRCRDALGRLFVPDDRLLWYARMKVLRRLAMADARKHYGAEKLSVDQVGQWPDVLFKKKCNPKDLPIELKKHRDEYHNKLLTPEHIDEVNAHWERTIKWRNDLRNRASEDGIQPIHDAFVDWAMKKPGLLYELAQAGIVPMQ